MVRRVCRRGRVSPPLLLSLFPLHPKAPRRHFPLPNSLRIRGPFPRSSYKTRIPTREEKRDSLPKTQSISARDMAPARANRAYEINDWVLCFHGPLLYKAKIIDHEPIDPRAKKSAWQYKVHYNGWKKTYVCLMLPLIPSHCYLLSLIYAPASCVTPYLCQWVYGKLFEHLMSVSLLLLLNYTFCRSTPQKSAFISDCK